MKSTKQLKANRRLAHAIAWIQIEKLFAMGESRISFDNRIMNRQEWSAYKLASIHKSLYTKDSKARGLDNKERNRRQWVNYAFKEKEHLESEEWRFMGITHKYHAHATPFFYTRRWYKKGAINPLYYEQREALRKEIEKADTRERMARRVARETRQQLKNERLVEQYRQKLEDSS